MIKAVIFDLDNTLLDFMRMKTMAIDAAINGMIEAGMEIQRNSSLKEYLKYMNQRDGNTRKFWMILLKKK